MRDKIQQKNLRNCFSQDFFFVFKGLSIEKTNGRAAGCRQRTSIFSQMKKEEFAKGEELEPEEHSEDIGEENGDEHCVINGALNYHNMQFVIKRPQVLVSNAK